MALVFGLSSMHADTMAHAVVIEYVYIGSTNSVSVVVINLENAFLILINSSRAELYAKIPTSDKHYTKIDIELV